VAVVHAAVAMAASNGVFKRSIPYDVTWRTGRKLRGPRPRAQDM